MTPKVRDVLKIFWKRGEIAHYERLLLLSTIFCYLLLDFYVKTGTRSSPREMRLFEITEFDITRVYSTSIFSGTRKFILKYQQFERIWLLTVQVRKLQYLRFIE